MIITEAKTLPKETVRAVIPVDGFIIDTTVDPMTVDVHIHGIKISVPTNDEIRYLLRKRPAQFRLCLEVTS
jgi:hypothetical protein